MLLRRSTDIHPKELARDMRQFFNSLLADLLQRIASMLATLGTRFQDHVERGFRGTANSRKAALGKDLSQAPLTGLRSKGEANFLAQRSRSAHHG